MDSCSIANAIEAFDVRLRNEDFSEPCLCCRFPKLPPMVGYATTLRVRAASPPWKGSRLSRSNRLVATFGCCRRSTRGRDSGYLSICRILRSRAARFTRNGGARLNAGILFRPKFLAYVTILDPLPLFSHRYLPDPLCRGLTSMVKMPVDLFPEIKIPVVVVATSLFGNAAGTDRPEARWRCQYDRGGERN